MILVVLFTDVKVSGVSFAPIPNIGVFYDAKKLLKAIKPSVVKHFR